MEADDYEDFLTDFLAAVLVWRPDGLTLTLTLSVYNPEPYLTLCNPNPNPTRP